jgi:hypothetical protein
MLRYSSEHTRTNLLAIVEREDEIRRTGAGEHAM